MNHSDGIKESFTRIPIKVGGYVCDGLIQMRIEKNWKKVWMKITDILLYYNSINRVGGFVKGS